MGIGQWLKEEFTKGENEVEKVVPEAGDIDVSKLLTDFDAVVSRVGNLESTVAALPAGAFPEETIALELLKLVHHYGAGTSAFIREAEKLYKEYVLAPPAEETAKVATVPTLDATDTGDGTVTAAEPTS